MLDYAREAVAFVVGRSRPDLDTDRMLAHALVRCIEVIGEAATHVSPQRRQQLPEIPWRAIIATRNRLIHAYHDVSFDIVWATTRDDLPSLIASLESLLAGRPEPENM